MRDALFALIQFMCEALSDRELVELSGLCSAGCLSSREARVGVRSFLGGGVTPGGRRLPIDAASFSRQLFFTDQPTSPKTALGTGVRSARKASVRARFCDPWPVRGHRAYAAS